MSPSPEADETRPALFPDPASTGRQKDPSPPREPGHRSTEQQSPAKVPYLGGLDGLRALAVIAVLLYHAEVSGWRGGFLGVEVFFVISGYLISSILLAEWRTTHRIDLKTFYIRRARRLLPALFGLLAAAALISVAFLPDEVATLRGDIGASLTYVTNWFYIVGQKSYFETSGRPSLLQHLWSLAVEEQFYLLWPIVFAAGMRWLGRARLLRATLAAALVSTALMALMYRSGEDPSRVYYGSDTRASGLLIGSALAFVWTPYRLRRHVGRLAPYLLDLVGVVSLGVLIYLLTATDENADALYRGGFAGVGLLTAVLIAAVAHPAGHVGRWLAVRPLKWIGLRSYGIYLFHWPVFQLTRPVLDVPLTGAPLFVLRFGLTFGLAAVSYRYLESPIRSGAWRRALTENRAAPRRERRRRSLRWATAGLASVVTLTLLSAAVIRATPPADTLLETGSISVGLPPAPTALPRGPSGTTTTSPDHSLGSTAGTAAPGTTVGTQPVPVTVDPTATTTTAVPVDTTPTTVPVAPVTEPPPPAPPPRITAIGDSVMLGASGALKSDLKGGDVFVDARVSRQVKECIEILTVWRDQGLLGDVVIVHIGNNGTFSEEQFAQLRDVLAAAPKVIFLNNKVPRRWEGTNNEVINNSVPTMPNAVLIDWKAEGDAHPELFAKDGMHLGSAGATFYAGLINVHL